MRTDEPGHDVPPGQSRRDGTGQGYMSPVRVPVVPGHAPAPDPAARYPSKASRRAAWLAWEANGEPWPPPAGLVSATIGACLKRDRRHERWAR